MSETVSVPTLGCCPPRPSAEAGRPSTRRALSARSAASSSTSPARGRPQSRRARATASWSQGTQAGLSASTNWRTRPAKPRRSASMRCPITSFAHHSPGRGCQDAAGPDRAAASARMHSMLARSRVAISFGLMGGLMGDGVAVGSAGMASSGHGASVGDGVAGAVEHEGDAPPHVLEIRRELLHGEAPESRAVLAAAHAAVEAPVLGLEGGGIEGLLELAGEAEPDPPQAAALDFEAQPLDHEWRVRGIEPVLLALARHEPAPVGLTPHAEKEEAERRRVHDLGAVVEDAAI